MCRCQHCGACRQRAHLDRMRASAGLPPIDRTRRHNPNPRGNPVGYRQAEDRGRCAATAHRHFEQWAAARREQWRIDAQIPEA